MRLGDWAIIALGAWTAFTGGWGIVESITGGGATAGDDLVWIASALLTAGIAIILLGLARARATGL